MAIDFIDMHETTQMFVAIARDLKATDVQSDVRYLPEDSCVYVHLFDAVSPSPPPSDNC